MSKNHKMFWTWDHCTNWTLNSPGNVNCGSGNAYTKLPGVFQKDYKRAIRWCAEHGVDGIGIVGLLRDKHGGVEAAKEVCGYARERGVRIYMIAGLYGYGGIYHEGNHPYSLDCFLKAHPQCMGRLADGSPMVRVWHSPSGGSQAELGGCPSNPDLKDFVLESLDWVFKEIPDLGGIQMETTDLGFCMCDRCPTRRGGNPAVASAISITDMADIYPDAVRTVLGRSPDAWAICETYHHFLPKNIDLNRFGFGITPETCQSLAAIPESAFLQWVCDHALATDSWHEGDMMPECLRKHRHIMRSHFGTYWFRNCRHGLEVERIRQQCRLSHLSGVRGISLFGESSVFHPGAEFNYLAMVYFTDHPLASLGDFADDVMGPRLGGKELAERYVALAATAKKTAAIPAAEKEIIGLLGKLPDAESARRWVHLASYLNTYLWESRQNEIEEQEGKG